MHGLVSKPLLNQILQLNTEFKENMIPNNSAMAMDETASKQNKAGYTATEGACGWAGAIFEATPSFGQEQ